MFCVIVNTLCQFGSEKNDSLELSYFFLLYDSIPKMEQVLIPMTTSLKLSINKMEK